MAKHRLPRTSPSKFAKNVLTIFPAARLASVIDQGQLPIDPDLVIFGSGAVATGTVWLHEAACEALYSLR